MAEPGGLSTRVSSPAQVHGRSRPAKVHGRMAICRLTQWLAIQGLNTDLLVHTLPRTTF